MRANNLVGLADIYPRALSSRARSGLISRLERNVTAAYAALEPAAIDIGGRWYAVARARCNELAATHGIEPARAAAIVAAISPRQNWQKNMANADAALRGEYRGLFAADARALVAGADIDRVLRGTTAAPKRAAFYANLCGRLEPVTIDIWALRIAAADMRLHDSDYGRLARADDDGPHGLYRIIAAAYTIAAARAAVAPAILQARVWSPHGARWPNAAATRVKRAA